MDIHGYLWMCPVTGPVWSATKPQGVAEGPEPDRRAGPDPDRSDIRGAKASHHGSWIMDQGSWIKDHGSWIKDQRSSIKYQVSRIKDQGSWTLDIVLA